MKKSIFAFIIAAIALCAMPVRGQQTDDDRLFPIPTVPDSKTTLSQRCNYLVDHFWDRCNIKQSFSTLSRLNKAFGEWASFMPYATADTVHMAVDRFIANVGKTGANNVLEVTKMAEQWFCSDSADYKSDELYLPFCKAVVATKKLPSAVRAQYEAKAKLIENSSIGFRAPDFEFERPDGSKGNFKDVIASRILIFFNDPDCFECSLMKARLSADYNTNQLIEAGLLKVVSIYPNKPDAMWREGVASYPETWVVGANEDIDTYFDIPETPTLYYLDARHKILGKDIDIENVLIGFQQINQNLNQ